MAKKISAIVSLVIIGVLIITTIIMANVNVNYSIRCEKPDAIYVEYASNSAKTRALRPDEEEDLEHYNKIWDFVSNASKENSLTALFNGNLNKKAEIKLAENSRALIPTTSDFYVTFFYENPQYLMDGNKKYTDGDGENFQYQELVFSISSMDEQGEINVYIKSDPTTKYYSRYYVLTADLGDLYNYLIENNFNK